MADYNESKRLDKDGGRMINIKELTIGDEVVKVPYDLVNFCGYFPRYTVKEVILRPYGRLVILETQKNELGNYAQTSLSEAESAKHYFYLDEFEKARQFAFEQINAQWAKIINAKEKLSKMEAQQ